MNKQIVEKVLEAAIRAPSGDNVQPWSFKVSEDYTIISLYNIPERDNSFFNYNQLASFISHGAVIENISISAKNFGYKADVELFPNDSNKECVAKIILTSSKEKNDYLYSDIFNRCTNRFKYSVQAVSLYEINRLVKSVSKINHAYVHVASERNIINILSRVLMINDRLVFEKEDIHRFLFREIRWNNVQVKSTRDGMPIDTLGLNVIEKLFFPLMRFWGVIRIANYLGLSRVIGLKCWANCRSSSLLGMITIDKNDKHGFVQGGRAMQRVWLEATNLGFAFQPIAGLAFLIYRLNEGCLDGFSEKQSQEVKDSAQSLINLFNLNENEIMVIGFRIGQSDREIMKTERKPVV